MRITSENIHAVLKSGSPIFQASQGSVRECAAATVANAHDSTYEAAIASGSILLLAKNFQESPNEGFYTKHNEALDFARTQVLLYLDRLNQTIFQDNPIYASPSPVI